MVTKIDLAVDQDKHSFRNTCLQAISDLQTIQTSNLDTIGKLEIGTKRIAQILEKTLRVFKSRI